MNVIGLGSAGCALAKKFSQYPQYTVYYLDTETHKEDGAFYQFQEYAKPEDYEANCPDLKLFFDDLSDDVLFIVGGSGFISGASLRILEQIKHCNLYVLYIQPNKDFLFGEHLLQERATFGIFQQYARSGLFERLYLVSNVSVEESLGSVSVADYFEKLNEAIVSTLHMIHIWKNTKPVMGNLHKPDEVERISTFGVMDVESGLEKLFFPLEGVTDKSIYYAINENSLKTETHLHGKIREQIKQKLADGTKVSFGIYPTEYVGSQAYVMVNTKIVQNERLDTSD